MVRCGLEAVLSAEEFVEGSELRVRYLEGPAAAFAHEMFVVVLERDVPPSQPSVAQRDAVDQPDPGQVFEDPVDGRRLYPARIISNVVDDQPCADERLVTRRQSANYGPSGKGQPEPGFPNPLDQQVFGKYDIVRHMDTTIL